MDYKPAPRDTSGVRLPREIIEVTELLARNTHENWANSGWRLRLMRETEWFG